MTSRISVIIPVFNGARYLAAAVDTALAQSGAELDIIIVDDGSTDQTANVASSLGPQIRYFRQEHAGAGAARNRAIEQSDAEFIALLDADDLWLPGKLAWQMAALRRDPGLGLVFGHVVQFISPELDAADQALLRCEPDPAPGYLPSTALVRTRDFWRVGGFDPTLVLGEFIDWHGRARDAGIAEFMCSEVVAHRRLHRQNLGVRRRDARGDYVKLLKSRMDRLRAIKPDHE